MAGDNRKEGVVSWPKVVLFGDSLTQRGFSSEGCWCSLTADYLTRKCDVLNRGFSGYTSRWCKLALPKLVTSTEAKDILLFTIFLGANDSNDSIINLRQHVPLEEFKQNLVEIVEYLQSIGVGRDKIVLIGPPAVDEQAWARYSREVNNMESGKTDALTKAYSQAVSQAASQSGTEFIDIFSEMKKSDNWRTMLVDGLHFSNTGSHFVFDILKPTIDRRTSHLPTLLPDWKDVNTENPEDSFNRL
ncbi:isoamyl acetate-hydrolyzing esterase 1 homolog [Liolophura sinensis]|uniref:isoamyl acetate-hydrolyzing esterase 1 homolog n=1 Tax=Liolophura sinensis TaxID=3198878 RepID=UPI00315911BC